ncbi:hypothetical protein BV133_3415 [Blastochloris viridis]|uniref:Uncharacterized protein n=1 Tax=Blastochloris viridis TaxID=1079 RepID=A0A182D6P9_BLAVI|nr:hypothetical protein BV133_3415 [Blastochloris viridis]
MGHRTLAVGRTTSFVYGWSGATDHRKHGLCRGAGETRAPAHHRALSQFTATCKPQPRLCLGFQLAESWGFFSNFDHTPAFRWNVLLGEWVFTAEFPWVR